MILAKSLTSRSKTIGDEQEKKKGKQEDAVKGYGRVGG